jgi:hypothetical protein
MFGVSFGRCWWLPVDMSKVRSTGCTTVQHQQEIARCPKHNGSYILPLDLGNRAITFAEGKVSIGGKINGAETPTIS